MNQLIKTYFNAMNLIPPEIFFLLEVAFIVLVMNYVMVKNPFRVKQ